MPSQPHAYLITFTTYGTWLQGRDPGWVDRAHNQFGSPIPAPDAHRAAEHRQRMKQPEYRLDELQRGIVLQTIREVAEYRCWKLWAAHVRGNHLHAVVTAGCKPEKVMSDFKSWASRRLREAFCESADRERWTEHGSTKYLWDENAVARAIEYVVYGQGEPMAVYDSRTEIAPPSSEPEASATDI